MQLLLFLLNSCSTGLLITAAAALHFYNTNVIRLVLFPTLLKYTSTPFQSILLGTTHTQYCIEDHTLTRAADTQPIKVNDPWRCT